MCAKTANSTPKVGSVVCGVCTLNEKLGFMPGIIHKVYNNGGAGLFQADNGPVFTVLPSDLADKQPALTVEEILQELTRIFRQPLADKL